MTQTLTNQAAPEAGNLATCMVCGNVKGNTAHSCREMMLGLRESFQYSKCARCGCLQLTNPPADLRPYYPPNYGCFHQSEHAPRNRVKRYLRKLRDRGHFHPWNPLARMLARKYPCPKLQTVAETKIPFHADILDVGCGDLDLVLRLRQTGFTRLFGIDPFLAPKTGYPSGITVTQCGLNDVRDRRWDLIMFHHSYEHMPDPVGVLRTVSHCQEPAGRCMIRMPVVSWAWREFATHWVQMDAPRHLVLHTENSFRHAATLAGLEVVRVDYESTGFQFWGSRLYQQDIALDKGLRDGLDKYFSPGQLRAFERAAEELNQGRQGDQAAFYLEKMRDH